MKTYLAYIPILNLYEPNFKGYDSTIDELASTSLRLPFERSKIKLGYFNFSFRKTLSDKILKFFKKKNIGQDYFIEVEIIVDTTRELELITLNHQESIDYLILQRIYNSIILFNIAKPGLFETRKGILLYDSKIIWEIERVFHPVVGAVISSINLKWPNIELVDIKKTWNWYFKYESGIDTISSSPIERAINAFSYLFDSSSDFRFGEIFWALVALEAIYCRGNYNLQGQLSLKTEIYLGRREEFKKSISKMYDFRSRFIHGDLNFPNKYFYDDLSEDFNDFYGSEYSQSVDLAVSIIIATFQKLIIEDKYEIEFETKLIE